MPIRCASRFARHPCRDARRVRFLQYAELVAPKHPLEGAGLVTGEEDVAVLT